MTKSLYMYTVLAIVLATGKLISGQNCSCAANLCCSQWGFCGTGDAFCGKGCQSGLCHRSSFTPMPTPLGRLPVSSIVTDQFFNSIINRNRSGCTGRSFYTRAAFLVALWSYPRFGIEGSAEDARREIAAFFAHVTHQTAHMSHIEEIDGSKHIYCQNSQEWPCIPGRLYFGRGPLQLTWNYNYGEAGRAIGFNGLNDPDIVARDPIISFKTALWFWMKNCHNAMVSGQGFGATIRAINGAVECNGGDEAMVTSRVNYYTTYSGWFRVDPGSNLRC